MRRKLVLLVTAALLTLAGGVVGAAPASADRDGPNPHSQNGQCTAAAAGLHKGWGDGPGNNERRNVGGTCPAG
jgi:hypothetical protein